MTAFSLGQQIEEVDRELKLRREVYPRWTGSGKMRKAEAEYHLARMESVRKTLIWLRENEAKIRQCMGTEKEQNSSSSPVRPVAAASMT